MRNIIFSLAVLLAGAACSTATDTDADSVSQATGPEGKDPAREARETRDKERRAEVDRAREREQKYPNDRAIVWTAQARSKEVAIASLTEAGTTSDVLEKKALVDYAESLQREMATRQAKLEAMRAERRAAVEKQVKTFLEGTRVGEKGIADTRAALESGAVRTILTQPDADLPVAKTFLEVMANTEFDVAFSKEVSAWATWAEERRDEMRDKSLEEMFDAYLKEYAAKKNVNVVTIPAFGLTAELFARQFRPKDGKHTLPGRDLSFTNEASQAQDRVNGHQQIIHFFQLAAALERDPATTGKLLDIVGEFHFKGTFAPVNVEGRDFTIVTFWGLFFDAFNNNHGWPFVPEHGSGSTQQIWSELQQKLKVDPPPP